MADNQMISGGGTAHNASGTTFPDAIVTNLVKKINLLRKSVDVLSNSDKRLSERKRELKTEFKATSEYVDKLNSALRRLHSVKPMKNFAIRNTKEVNKNLLATRKVNSSLIKQETSRLAILKQIRRVAGDIAAQYKIAAGYAGKLVGITPSGRSSVPAPVAKASQNIRTSSPMAGGPASSPGLSQGWLSGAKNQAKYWLRLGAGYRLLGKVTKGFTSFSSMLETVNRAVRTAVKDVNDWNEVSLARAEIQDAAIAYLSRHTGTIEQYTESIYQLTQAEMKRSEAIKLAPTVMSLSTATDAPIKETARLLVGINELFRTKLASEGLKTDSERVQKIAAVMTRAVKLEITTIEQLTKSLAYVAPIGLKANMSIEELVASIAMLHSNLLQSSKAGTGMRQLLNSLAKNGPRLNEIFKLNIKMDQPLAFTKILGKMATELDGGAISAEKLREVLKNYGLRGSPSILILSEQFAGFKKLVDDLQGANIDELLGTRKIMEMNLPAQMKILSKNVDLTVASFLRGAIGGGSFAESLNKVNNGMLPVFATARSLGSTWGVRNRVFLTNIFHTLSCFNLLA